ncbi:MAG: asparaginase [Acidimicrobiales bacterium]
MSEPLVEVLRWPLVDAVHRGDVAVVDVTGRLRASIGDPRGLVTYWRSAAKPFQALPVVSSGAAAHWRLTDQDLALIAGSHSGEIVHTERAGSLLARTGHQAEELTCGIHPPLDALTASALVRSGDSPGPLHNNCSGKHIGMLALASELGADPAGYTRPDHLVQREILETVACFAGISPAEIVVGIDGCGVPCFGTSLYHLALAFARLMDASAIPAPWSDAARSVREAMMRHPYLVAGRGRLDTGLMEVGGGTLLAKGGAGGLQCVATTEGLGIAVRIEDGGAPGPVRPSGVATIEVLRQLALLGQDQVDRLSEHGRPTLRALSGSPVGEARFVGRLSGSHVPVAGGGP